MYFHLKYLTFNCLCCTLKKSNSRCFSALVLWQWVVAGREIKAGKRVWLLRKKGGGGFLNKLFDFNFANNLDSSTRESGKSEWTRGRRVTMANSKEAAKEKKKKKKKKHTTGETTVPAFS